MGHFSELYDETNIRRFTVYVPMPSTFSFSKKAILQVEGKVLVGYDLKNIKITAPNPQNMTSKNARLIGLRLLRFVLVLAIAYLY